MTIANDIVERQAAILVDMDNLAISDLEVLANAPNIDHGASEEDRARKLLCSFAANLESRRKRASAIRTFHDSRDDSDFRSLIELLGDIQSEPNRDMFVDEKWLPKVNAAFPEGSDCIISVAKVTRCKLMLLGLEVVGAARLLDVVYDEFGEALQVGYTNGLIVRLPDGSGFEVKGSYDIAELRAKLNLPRERAAAD